MLISHEWSKTKVCTKVVLSLLDPVGVETGMFGTAAVSMTTLVIFVLWVSRFSPEDESFNANSRKPFFSPSLPSRRGLLQPSMLKTASSYVE